MRCKWRGCTSLEEQIEEEKSEEEGPGDGQFGSIVTFAHHLQCHTDARNFACIWDECKFRLVYCDAADTVMLQNK